MKGGESVLARWSRLKREAAAETRDPKGPPVEAEEPTPPAGKPEIAPDLPPLESIDAASDIAAFLAPGVPAEVTCAALRRAWTADPAIRDFIGLSENSWDFTAADGVPGFGSLSADEVRRLLDDMLAEAPPTDRSPPAVGTAAEVAEESADPSSGQAEAESLPSTAAAQKEDGDTEAAEISPRRRHGSALPQ